MKVKEENKKAGLKYNIQKIKIMASSPITSWQSDEEKVETVSYFICLDSKSAADCDAAMENKQTKTNKQTTKKNHLLLGRKAIKKFRQCTKSWGITLLTKVFIVKDMVFPVVMCGCEIWTIKKAET